MILYVTDVVNKLILKGSVLFAARNTRTKVHLILKYINHSRADVGIVRQVNGSHVTDYIAEKDPCFLWWERGHFSTALH